MTYFPSLRMRPGGSYESVAITETIDVVLRTDDSAQQVHGNYATGYLTEKPYKGPTGSEYTVAIVGKTLVHGTPSSVNEFSVNWQTGVIFLDPSLDGTTVSVTYRGIGAIVDWERLALTVQDEGITVDDSTRLINFVGSAVTVTQTSDREVEVDISGGGNTNIALLDTTFPVDDPSTHTYKTLRAAVDNEPVGTTFIFQQNSQTFEVDAVGGAMTLNDITFRFAFSTGSVFIDLNEAIDGTITCSEPKCIFRLRAGVPISNVQLQLKSTYFLLHLSNTTATALSNLFLYCMEGSNTIFIGEEFGDTEGYTEHIEQARIGSYNCKVNISLLQADEVHIDATTNSEVNVSRIPCAYAYVECDQSSRINSSEGDLGFCITSYVGATPGPNSRVAYLTPDISGEASIIITVNPYLLITPDSYFDWRHMVGPEDDSLFYDAYIKGKVYIQYPVQSTFDSTYFTSGMGMNSSQYMQPLQVYCNDKMDLTIVNDLYSELYQYAYEYFTFTGYHEYKGATPRISLKRNTESYIYFHWHNTLAADIDDKRLIYFNSRPFKNVEIYIERMSIARFSGGVDTRRCILVHDNTSTMYGGMKDVSITCELIVAAGDDYFDIIPYIGKYTVPNYADSNNAVVNIGQLTMGDPTAVGANEFVLRSRYSRFNFGGESIGKVIVDGTALTDQYNTISDLTEDGTLMSGIILVVNTDYNRIINCYVDNIVLNGNYNHAVNNLIEIAVTDSGFGNFINEYCNTKGTPRTYVGTITNPGSWVDGGAYYYATITHNLNTNNIIAQVWEDDGFDYTSVSTEVVQVTKSSTQVEVRVSKVPDLRFDGIIKIIN